MQNLLLYRKRRSFTSRHNCVGWRQRASQRLSSQASINVIMPSRVGLIYPTRAARTAFQALVLVGNIKSGDDVLIHAAASGVGIAAIQLARFYGAYVGHLPLSYIMAF